MSATLRTLQTLIMDRARFRICRPHLTSYRVQIDDTPEKDLRRPRLKLRFERSISESLRATKACYNGINQDVQSILEVYSDVLGGASHTVECAGLEQAIDALRYLEKDNATFKRTVNSLLHAVFLSDSDAWDHLFEMQDMSHA
jgi:hypothetical protein